MLRNSARWLLAALTTFAALPASALAQSEPLQGRIANVGEMTFEPTVGVDSAGRIYFSVTRSPGVAAGWRPGMFMSADDGATWKDISPSAAGVTIPPETNDPFIYVDQSTGRAINFHMAPILTCTGLSYSDDAGESWTQSILGCGGQFPYDHQTIVAFKPRQFTTTGYPNVLLQCVNSIHSEECSRSIDGGRTWLPTNPAYANNGIVRRDGGIAQVGTQTGHLAAAPDGTVYLPTSEGGQNPVVWVTQDDGLTWTRRQISDMAMPFDDPAVAVDQLGNVYAAWVNGVGNLLYAVSRDQGATWTPPQLVATGVTAMKPALDVGDPGKVVIAFPGTDDLPQGFDTGTGKASCGTNDNCVGWDADLAISYNALDPGPTFQTVTANGDGPLFRGRTACQSGGRCAYLVDFIDVTVGPNGRPYASFARGCTDRCLTDPRSKNNVSGTTGWGILATLASGPTLCETGCRYKFTPPA
jgi:photosystem II stability/assembly factor-like uncharacterized protein